MSGGAYIVVHNTLFFQTTATTTKWPTKDYYLRELLASTNAGRNTTYYDVMENQLGTTNTSSDDQPDVEWIEREAADFLGVLHIAEFSRQDRTQH